MQVVHSQVTTDDRQGNVTAVGYEERGVALVGFGGSNIAIGVFRGERVPAIRGGVQCVAFKTCADGQLSDGPAISLERDVPLCAAAGGGYIALIGLRRRKPRYGVGRGCGLKGGHRVGVGTECAVSDHPEGVARGEGLPRESRRVGRDCVQGQVVRGAAARVRDHHIVHGRRRVACAVTVVYPAEIESFGAGKRGVHGAFEMLPGVLCIEEAADGMEAGRQAVAGRDGGRVADEDLHIVRGAGTVAPDAFPIEGDDILGGNGQIEVAIGPAAALAVSIVEVGRAIVVGDVHRMPGAGTLVRGAADGPVIGAGVGIQHPAVDLRRVLEIAEIGDVCHVVAQGVDGDGVPGAIVVGAAHGPDIKVITRIREEVVEGIGGGCHGRGVNVGRYHSALRQTDHLPGGLVAHIEPGDVRAVVGDVGRGQVLGPYAVAGQRVDAQLDVSTVIGQGAAVGSRVGSERGVVVALSVEAGVVLAGETPSLRGVVVGCLGDDHHEVAGAVVVERRVQVKGLPSGLVAENDILPLVHHREGVHRQPVRAEGVGGVSDGSHIDGDVVALQGTLVVRAMPGDGGDITGNADFRCVVDALVPGVMIIGIEGGIIAVGRFCADGDDNCLCREKTDYP